MRARNTFARWAALMMVLLFLLGLAHLMLLRFESGNVYPPYSTLRSGPLGAKALYEALWLMPGLRVERGLTPLEKNPGLGDAALFVIGLSPYEFKSMDAIMVRALERGAEQGGRVIIAFSPLKRPAEKDVEADEDDKRDEPDGNGPAPEDSAEKEPNGQSVDEEESSNPIVYDLSERWSVDMGLSRPAPDTEDSEDETGPSEAVWVSDLAFSPQDPAWRICYTNASGQAAIIERAYGKGSIVLAADAFFLSNEAMKEDRAVRLIAWLCGPYTHLILDETHLGVGESPGLASLLRGYGLMPFFAALTGLALLTIWRMSSAFIPPADDGNRAGAPANTGPIANGKDYSAALVNLLQRNLSESQLMQACLDETRHAFGRHPDMGQRLAQGQKIISGMKKTRSAVNCYQEIAEILAPVIRRARLMSGISTRRKI